MTAIPPGPRAPTLLQTLRWLSRPIPMLEDCQRRYGDVFTIRLASFPPMVMFSDPAAVKTIFTADPEHLRAGEANVVLAPFLGNDSVLLADGTRHRRKRRLMMPPFHGERMQLYGAVMREIADRVMDTWPLGTAFPIHAETQRITLDVILRAVFGIEEGGQFDALRSRMVEGAAVVTEHPMLMIKALQRDLGRLTSWRRVTQIRAEVDQMLFAEFARRRTEQRTDRTDVLTLLLAARDEDGEPMSDQELRDEMVTLLLAGHETTATTLAWVLQYVLTHADVHARLSAEIAAYGDPNRLPGSSDLPFLEATIKETQRLMPIIPMVGRKLHQPTRIGGYDLPAGVVAAPSIFLTHRRPDLWEAPDAFRPDRFLGKRPSPFEFFPFGGGTRACLGATFASFEMKIVLARMLTRLELRAVPGYRARIVRRGVAFAPSEGMPVVVERRAA
jgi:cytochrome P450 family 110